MSYFLKKTLNQTFRNTTHITARLSHLYTDMWRELTTKLQVKSKSEIIKESLRVRSFLLHQQIHTHKIQVEIINENGEVEVVEDLIKYLELSSLR